VVFNQRTGTIVMGENVPIDKVLISHGNLSIQIDTESKAKEEKAGTVTRVGGATVGQLIRNLNALGLKPQDMISIFQSIHSAGAMQAELKVL
jgi:flagellar P-ring protein precursor FlgI